MSTGHLTSSALARVVSISVSPWASSLIAFVEKSVSQSTFTPQWCRLSASMPANIRASDKPLAP